MSIQTTCWDDHFLCVYTQRNSVLVIVAMRRIPSLGASIICSACCKRLTDKNISIPSASFSAVSNDENASRECVIALFQINTFHAIYLLTLMVFFVKQILDMLLYIVYFLLYVSFLCRSVVEAIIFGHLFVSNRDRQQRYIRWNILQQIKSI